MATYREAVRQEARPPPRGPRAPAAWQRPVPPELLATVAAVVAAAAVVTAALAPEWEAPLGKAAVVAQRARLRPEQVEWEAAGR